MAGIDLEHVRDAGVVGAGGAGFPTHVKLSAHADTVLLNAAECEPLFHKDKEILRNFPQEVLRGLAAAMQMVGAKRGSVAIKDKYGEVIDAIRPALGPNMEIAPLRDTYPAGDEFVLVYDVLGRVVGPGGLPLDVGAVVINVETALNVSASAQGPVTQKFVTVGGAVAEPVTLRVPVGVTLSACVAAAGGPTIPDANYLVGGVMMGHLQDNHDALVDKTTAGVIVLGSDHVVVRRRRRDFRQIARIGKSACDQCSFCTELCPRYLLGHPIQPHRAMRSLQFNLVGQPDVIGTAYCSECNLCSLYACPEDLDPKDVCARNKRRLAEQGDKWQGPPFNPERPKLHLEDRKAPMARLMRKLGLAGFRNVGPLSNEFPSARKVGIALKQHIGVPCEPLVSVGQKVTAGEPVGRPPVRNGEAAMGAPVHASIDGTVTAVKDGIIWVEK